MVSFSCEACGDVLTKKKLDPHRNRCRGATFTCIDCMTYFPGTEYRSHTSCISEAQKYQGALYREKKNNKAQKPAQQSTPAQSQDKTQTQTQAQNKQPTSDAMVAHPAYVEDANDDFEDWRKFQVPGQLESEDDDDEENQPVNRLPEAPTPPPAVPTMPNVFDFLVNNPTPTASHVSLPATAAAVPQPNENNQLVRFDPEANGMADDPADDTAVVQYGNSNGNSNGSAPATNFETPAPKEVRRIVKDTGKESSGKKDKKRKRDLHIDVDMTDAPPVLHTGLTGGLSRMMSKSTVFPPSPDSYDAPEAETPASPLKKSKSKHHRSSRPSDSIGTSIMAMISGNSGKHKSSSSSKKRAKTQHKSNTSPSSKPKKKKTSSSHTKTLEAPKQPKLLEFRPVSKDGNKDGDSGALIVYKPPAEHFLSFVNKGPESERGCSVNKALKRYHRERSASGTSVNKVVEEKELWKSLRMKRNERGEIVLFTLDS